MPLFKRFISTLFILSFLVFDCKSQTVIEFGIKPTEFALLNFETNFAVGNAKTRYGIYLSFRPSTQESGLVKGIGTGFIGGYEYNQFNKLYNSFTVGLYHKLYLNKALSLFLETDIFYRNWNFKDKYAEFDNVESYRFKGVRTENIDVFGLKVLFGKTIFLLNNNSKIRPYLDVFAGLGIRYKELRYETYNGYVGDVFYTYNIEKIYYKLPTPQIGFKIGIIIKK